MGIYLVRHPKPRRSEGLCYGRTELPVDPEVLADAVASLRSRIPADVLRHATIFTSPASRCLGLARALASPREPAIVGALREMDFGAWEGRPWDSLARAELDAWASDVWAYRAGGGESAAMVAARWRRWAASVAVQIAGRGTPVIAVTHAGLIRVALAGVGRLGPDLAAAVPFASVHRLDVHIINRFDLGAAGDFSAADIDASQACAP